MIIKAETEIKIINQTSSGKSCVLQIIIVFVAPFILNMREEIYLYIQIGGGMRRCLNARHKR